MSNKKKATSDGVKLLKHIVIITILVVVGAAAAHFGLVLFTRHSAHCTVPEFKGLILNEAENLAASSDLNIIINDSLYAPMYEGGMVLDQLPKAGVVVKPGRTIYVTINAFGAKMVTVPYVAGRSLRQAKNMLEVAGLQIAKLIYEPDMATNYVLAQFCGNVEIIESSNHDAVIGSGVTLRVGMSDRNNTAITPQLIGMTLGEAKSRLWELGFNVGQIKLPKDATLSNQDKAIVYAQSVTKGGELTLGSSVSISLTFDTEQVNNILKEVAKMEREEAKRKAQEAEEEAERIRLMESMPQQSVERNYPEPTSSAVVEEEADSFFE